MIIKSLTSTLQFFNCIRLKKKSTYLIATVTTLILFTAIYYYLQLIHFQFLFSIIQHWVCCHS